MIPPKYNFYIGKADNNLIYFNSHTSIDGSGNYNYEATSDKYASSKTAIQVNRLIFFNLISINNYNAIFFYDKDQKLIFYKALVSVNNTIIVPPVNAKYFAVRFTTADANFAAKKDTKFI